MQLLNKKAPDFNYYYNRLLEKATEILPELNKKKTYREKLVFWLSCGLGFEHNFSDVYESKEKKELIQPVSFIEPRTIDEMNIFKRYYFNWYQTKSGFAKLADYERDYGKKFYEGCEADNYTLLQEEMKRLETKIKDLRNHDIVIDTDFYLLGYNSSERGTKDNFLDEIGHDRITVEDLYTFCVGYNEQQLYQFLRKKLWESENDILMKKSPKTVKTQKIKGYEKKEMKYEKLEEIFDDLTTAKECISALMNVNPSVIDKNMKFRLGSRQKGSIIAWVQILKEKDKICAVDNFIITRLLNKKMHGLKLGKSARSFRNKETTAYRKYYRQFDKLIT